MNITHESCVVLGLFALRWNGVILVGNHRCRFPMSLGDSCDLVWPLSLPVGSEDGTVPQKADLQSGHQYFLACYLKSTYPEFMGKN